MVNMTDVSNDEQKPAGADFKISLAGRDIWFANMLESQRITLSRIERRTHGEIQDVVNGDGDVKVKTKQISNLIDGLYQKIWDAIDSTIIEDADRVFLEDAMLTRKLEMKDALRVFRQGQPEPAPDDAEPVVKSKPVRAARKAVAAKKTVANAGRVRK